MKKTILVTGGTGFIGSHTTVELQAAGYNVVIIDNLSNSKAEVIDGIEKISGTRPAFEQVDCCDYAALEGVFQKYPGIEGIIHFAASKAVGESVEKPLKYYRNNFVSLINLLELMPKYNVKGIIFSSSCTVYGQPDPQDLPVSENAPIKKAESPYGNTKQVNEEIIQDFVASGAPISAIILRYFNPIGAHPTARTVARDNLFKCAMFGSDPNWGRVLAAVGMAPADMDPDNISVSSTPPPCRF